jgi:hypothetical protein
MDAAEGMGLSGEQVQALSDATQLAYSAVLKTLIEANAYNWQAFGAEDWTQALLPVKGGQTCIAAMRALCTPEMRSEPKLVSAPGANRAGTVVPLGSMKQMVAAFLIARGDYWWFGQGWGPKTCTSNSSLPFPYNSLWSISPGSPVTNCSEVATGVFQRTFARGSSTLDCNTFNASLDF